MLKSPKTAYNNIRGDYDMPITIHVVICKDKETDGYWATCLELYGCNTQGDTVEEIVENMRNEAIPLCLYDSYEIKAFTAEEISRYMTKENPFNLEYSDYKVVAVKEISLEDVTNNQPN